MNIELGHIELGLTSAPSHLRRALLKISQYSCQSADQLVNEVSFLECFPPSRANKWRTVGGLKASDKTHRWLGLKGEIGLGHHLRLYPSGSVGVTLSKCNRLWKCRVTVLSSCHLTLKYGVCFLRCALLSQAVVLTAVMLWGKEWKREREPKWEKVKEGAWKREGEGESVLLAPHWLLRARRLFA